MNKRFLASVFVLSVAMIVGACGGDGGNSDEGTADAGDQEEVETQTYAENDVTFEYPADWDEFSADAAASSAGSNELWDATVGPDETDLVNITGYQINIEVTEENIVDIEAELNGVIQQVVDQAGGTLESGPTQTTHSGFPAYEYEWSGVKVDQEVKDSRAVFLFNGNLEYFLNCQYSAETEEEILAGCDLILETFEATGG